MDRRPFSVPEAGPAAAPGRLEGRPASHCRLPQLVRGGCHTSQHNAQLSCRLRHMHAGAEWLSHQPTTHTAQSVACGRLHATFMRGRRACHTSQQCSVLWCDVTCATYMHACMRDSCSSHVAMFALFACLSAGLTAGESLGRSPPTCLAAPAHWGWTRCAGCRQQ